MLPQGRVEAVDDIRLHEAHLLGPGRGIHPNQKEAPFQGFRYGMGTHKISHHCGPAGPDPVKAAPLLPSDGHKRFPQDLPDMDKLFFRSRIRHHFLVVSLSSRLDDILSHKRHPRTVSRETLGSFPLDLMSPHTLESSHITYGNRF